VVVTPLKVYSTAGETLVSLSAFRVMTAVYSCPTPTDWLPVPAALAYLPAKTPEVLIFGVQSTLFTMKPGNERMLVLTAVAVFIFAKLPVLGLGSVPLVPASSLVKMVFEMVVLVGSKSTTITPWLKSLDKRDT